MPDLAVTYQKKTDIEHILDAPDTYIGAVEADVTRRFSFEGDAANLSWRATNWIPGLYKCFDEAIVNCGDHVIRMSEKIKKGEKKCIPVKLISIEVDKKSGIITMTNDGNGIDVAKHPEYDLWIPEMVLAHLRTSTNYNKEEKKIVGGKNGFGFKLVLIYSLWGRIETIDHTRKLKYTQEFKNNLSYIGTPTISKDPKTKPYTKISFLPDYKRFGISKLSDDMFNLFRKRVYDIAAITARSVKVKFNNEIISVKSFEDYIDLYIGSNSDTERIYERAGVRWEYAVCLTPLDEFTQISFVNGICTNKGGKHVDYILNQITRKLVIYIENKKKIRVKPTTIKEQLMLFINCVIENPAFDSQTKDYMNLPVAKFGSSCVISDKFIDKIAKMGVMEAAISLNEVKDNKAAKKSDGRKTKRIMGIPKLIDANFAGTARSKDTMLILCEGDSAKAGIVSGLSKKDRDFIGVFPLKGKPPNIRDLAQQRINQNEEISAIKKIVGLEINKSYSTRAEVDKALRYSKILFMTDQDLDGSHIKGLCINIFHSLWPELFKLHGFIGFMNTPILKAKKGKREISFYNEAQYVAWKKVNSIKRGKMKGWRVKYYKGLGTSTSKEFKEYFAKKKIVFFNWHSEKCDNAMDMVFNKKRSNDRKKWLEAYDRSDVLDTRKGDIPYEEFIHKEMIHFSKYDCERSIPNVVDGLKTSQRKCLYAAFKRKLTKEVKVAQLSGYISEQAAYHHGEMSLQKTIVGLAQDFVGANNINLFLPNGQFGTRLQGGKDSASERYIYTLLNPITYLLFPELDNSVLAYKDDDGAPVEPEYYAPIIPLILVNGGKGIGTGFSTDIPQFDPKQITQYIKNRLRNKSNATTIIQPYYKGFKGKITKISPTKYLFQGIYRVISTQKVRITELPIGMWTQDYKQFLEKMMEKKDSILRDYQDMSTEKEVEITLTLKKGALMSLISKMADNNCSMFDKKFRMYTTKTTSNMHLFDAKQRMKHYKTIEDIIDDYFPVRLALYEKRRKYLISVLNKLVVILHNKARFIEEQCEDTLDLRRKTKAVISEILKQREYDMADGTYNYLMSMPFSSVLEENIKSLRRERDKKKVELEKIEGTTAQHMWRTELKKFSKYIKSNANL